MSFDGREETAASRSNGYDRRHQIVEVARSLFEERGLAHTTVKDIARESGVARGLFYYYFADKDAVIEAVLDAYVDDFIELVEHWNESRTRYDVQSALHDCITLMRRAIFDKDAFRHALTNKENAALYLDFLSRTAEAVARYVTETTAIEYGRFHHVRIDHIYDTFYMLIVGMIGYIRHHPDADDEVLECLVAQTLHLDLDGSYMLGGAAEAGQENES
ncbi:TetR/AcrR family transcriptional regulator [Slackia exigua]|uniref:TetR/AcrR family transcriptional regulator n=1 Tax=Slackia exigua TaxID=84109 RepID=UPI00254FF1FE|nr:TetR/AcrR family transcriptional regulator [Slackia exigua]MDK7723623.1 TetR/AcrR family transcriptional regulator [Slackia exigua]MDK7725789.1 TetR/AcrR family transcriptional regulator [Slackia exigua]